MSDPTPAPPAPPAPAPAPWWNPLAWPWASLLAGGLWADVLSFAAGVLATLAVVHFTRPPGPAPEPAADIALDAEYRTAVGVPVEIAPRTKGSAVRWHGHDRGLSLFAIPGDAVDVLASAGAPGRYKLGAFTAVGGRPTAIAWTTVVVGDVPPGPGPGPDPPVPPVPPVPPPDPAPIPAPGFRALLIYESAEVSKLPKAQAQILTDGDVRSYLNAHCAKGPGGTPEYRFWDKDIDAGNENVVWQQAMRLPRTTLPWLIVSNGQTGYSGPLPADAAGTLAILKKYGGP